MKTGRKNEMLFTDGIVRKTFRSVAAYQRELNIYKRLEGTGLAPALLQSFDGENTLWISYEGSKTLLDFYERCERTDELMKYLSTAKKLIDSLVGFNKITGMIYGDVNLKNFLLKDDGICCIDFEDSREGDIHEDIAESLLFHLTYTPSLTSFKKDICRRIAEYFLSLPDADRETLRRYFYVGLENLEKRRGIKVVRDFGYEVPI